MRILRLLFGLALILAIGAGFVFWQARKAWLDAGPLPAPVQLVMPRGGSEAIAAVLLENRVIRDGRAFALAAWLTRGDGPLRAAEFAFPAGASLRDVLGILRTARPVQRRLTIPEGLTARQITALLERAEGLTGEMPPLAEAALLPETYAYQWGDSRAALLRRAEAALREVLDAAWAARAPNLPISTAREALILASIVERETGLAAERPRIAGVFTNRLRRAMPLQSDPTVIYAAAEGGTLDRPITRADLDREHPFNTYRIRGLPPAPIAAPGRDAIQAVTRPLATEELYFVADGTGGHAFARTLEEHNRNVARWREIERQRSTPSR